MAELCQDVPTIAQIISTSKMLVLHIDSAITGQNSISRLLSQKVVDRILRLSPDAVLSYHDLAASPLPPLSAKLLSLRFGGSPEPEDEGNMAMVSDALERFIGADIVVLGAPMYNFGISSHLKVWLDHLAVAGKTFRYTERGPEGLMRGKKLIIASVRGGTYAPGGPGASADFQEPYLRIFFGFLGIDDISIVRAEGVAISDAHKTASLAVASAAIDGLDVRTPQQLLVN